MIQLHPDYLLFETAQGQIIPCSAELIAVELIGEAAETIDLAVVREAAAAVLHYFRQDLGWTTVSVGEFSRALADALQALGIRTIPAESDEDGTSSCDLRRLICGTHRSIELAFFPTLREALRARMAQASPAVLRFHGLRGCVKQLTGAKRWTQRCQALNDQIVEYLRACLASEFSQASCGLIVR